MAVIRQGNFLNQQRIDIPDIRSIESAVAADFDVLAGRSWAHEKAYVLRGLQVTGAAVGSASTGIQVSTADSILFNAKAAVSGTFLWVPSDRAPETLNPVTNSRVTGSWTPGATNYVGIDFSRDPDSSTADLTKFRDATPGSTSEIPRQVPKAKTMDYVLVITTIPFSGQSNLVPVCRVSLDAAGLVTECKDCRPMMFRLGSGGDSPSASHFFNSWTRSEPQASLENTSFTAGDRQIASLKDWQDAVMTRLWEIGGGEFWYSATTDRNVELVTYGTPFANGEYFDWNLGSQTLQYKNLRLLFDNSSSYSADIVNGSYVLAPGEVLYVDALRDRFYAPAWLTATVYAVGDLAVNNGLAYECTVTGTSGGGPSGTGSSIPDGSGSLTWRYVGVGVAGGLVAQKASLFSLGTGSPPGSRLILAWRRGTEIFTRGWRYPVGTTFQPATSTSLGVVKLSRTASTPLQPIVISDTGGTIAAPDAATVPLVIKAFTAGTDIQQWQSQASSVLARITNTGKVAFSDVGDTFWGGTAFGTRFFVWQFTGGTGATLSEPSGAAYSNFQVLKNAITTSLRSTTTASQLRADDAGTAALQFVTTDIARWQVATTGELQAVGGNRAINNVLDPVNPQDAVTKVYADNLFQPQNALINGRFDFWQRGTAFLVTTKQYTADRWYSYTAAPTQNAVDRYTTSLPTHVRYSLRHRRLVGSSDPDPRVLAQEVDRDHTISLRGRLLRLTFWARSDTGLTGSVLARVTTGTGAETQNVTSPYTGSSNIGEMDPISLTTTWTKFELITSAVPAGATTMAVWFQHSPTGTAGANDGFMVAGIMLTDAAALAPSPSLPFLWCGGSIESDYQNALRYWEQSYEAETPVATNTADGLHRTNVLNVSTANGNSWALGYQPRFAVEKRAIPAVDIWDSSGVHNAWFVGASQASLAGGVTKKTFYVYNNTGGPVTPSAGLAAGHWVANAEL